MRLLDRILLVASPLVSTQLCAAIPLNQPATPASGDLHNALPSQDEWYNPPSGWESKVPGTPLRVRPHAYKVVPTFNYSDVVQILFRSTDSHDKPIVAATTLFIPWSHAPCMNNTKWSNDTSPERCSRTLISYQHPYDTACFDASPSWALQNGDRWGELTLGLNRGWFMAVPDYEGPRASFGANIVAGHVILDSVRALLQIVGQFGFRTNESRVGLWGYSSGGTATDFALEFAPTYAPELKFAGAVVGGMTANQTESSSLLNGRDIAGLLVQGLLGMTTDYPDQRKYLDSRLKSSGQYSKQEFYMAGNMSARDSMAIFQYQNIFEYFIGGKPDVYAPQMTALMEQEGVAGVHGTPNVPVFVHQSLNDEYCPGATMDRLVDKYCKNGANIFYQRNVVGNHNRQLANAQRSVITYLEDVLTGRNNTGYPATGCKIETVSIQHDDDVPWW